MLNLFAYGTLIFEDVMQRVAGRRFRSMGAVLHDYSRHRIRETPYPAIVYEKGAAVNGKIYFNIDDRSLALLDDYEDDYYIRTKVTVTAEDGREYEAHTYVIMDEFRGLLSRQGREMGIPEDR